MDEFDTEMKSTLEDIETSNFKHESQDSSILTNVTPINPCFYSWEC